MNLASLAPVPADTQPPPSAVRTVPQRSPMDEEAIGRALDRFRSVLHARSSKMSRVRESIARTALTYPGHFSVEDLVRELHANGVRDAHMATVYRAMPLMVEAGLVQPALVSQSDGQRYEATFERERHDHLVCTGCGLVVEYSHEAIEAMQREIADRYGFQLDAHIHELRGRCTACRSAKVKAPPST
jgi:Fur family ferric uptake transcriptional regulator